MAGRPPSWSPQSPAKSPIQARAWPHASGTRPIVTPAWFLSTRPLATTKGIGQPHVSQAYAHRSAAFPLGAVRAAGGRHPRPALVVARAARMIDLIAVPSARHLAIPSGNSSVRDPILSDGGNSNAPDAVEAGIHPIHEGVASFQQRPLLSLPHPAARLLAVAGIQAVDDGHAIHDGA